MALSMPLAAETGIFPGKFWRNEFFLLYLQSRNESSGIFAEIAQLVERNLAKVEVAGPSPVFRSGNQQFTEMRLLIFLFARGRKQA